MPPRRKQNASSAESAASQDGDLFQNSADSYDSDEDEDEDEDEGEGLGKQSECIRKVSNFSLVKAHDLLDKTPFNPEYLKMRLPLASPKMVELLQRIQRLDEQDLKRHGTYFKHFIFTDQRSSSYGVKLVASALVAHGFQPAFHVQGTGFQLLDAATLASQSKENNARTFGVLISKSFYDRSLSVAYKKKLLEAWNQRPDNIHGQQIRFMVLDQGFKEGIDLYDVKYVHLLEPLVNPADQKQAIGRGTRFCGQRGLQFHPTFGWPLYVFKYDVQVNAKPLRTMHDLYLEYSDLDMRKIAFAAEVESLAIEGAVDASLTRAIHGFSIPPPSPILSARGSESLGGSGASGGAGSPVPPAKKLQQREMTKYIQTYFGKRFTYDNLRLENNCQSGGAKKKDPKSPTALPAGTLVQFTPTQDFIRHYYTPASPYKGMLLFHSVGTGKTCTAIATATSTFEPQGYTILWVTRHTLKSDIFKNLFKQVCSLVFQAKLKDGSMRLPKTLGEGKRHLSDQWIEPISYKQFTNLLLKKNKYYEAMVKRNGQQDPLKKTLLIIDEAHKLYSPSVAASERPNTDILEQMVQHSYTASGADSVRILLMTATPYTDDGMEMIQLLNLLRPATEQFPDDFDAFAASYLGPDGTFTAAGRTRWLNQISGYISYLNRSKDARNFAYPVLENVLVPITLASDPLASKERPADGLMVQMTEHKDTYKAARELRRTHLKNIKRMFKDEIAECLAQVKEELEQAKEEFQAAKTACKDAADKARCMKDAKDQWGKRQTELKAKKDACKDTQGSEDLKDSIEGIERDYREMTGDYLALKAKYDAYVEERRGTNAELKELRPQYKEIRPKVKQLQSRVKALRLQARTIKNAADRKKALQAIQENEGAAYKATYKEYKRLKDTLLKLRIKNKVSRMHQGSTTLGDISQETILNKRCGVNV